VSGDTYCVRKNLYNSNFSIFSGREVNLFGTLGASKANISYTFPYNWETLIKSKGKLGLFLLNTVLKK